MFLPPKKEDEEKKQLEDTQRKEDYIRIETLVTNKIPENIRDGLIVNVEEVQCGDPNCSPIDTAIAVLFPSGGRGMFGIPAESKNIKEEDLNDYFPTEEVLEAWGRGEEANWPPSNSNSIEDLTKNLPELRFEVGARVQCRVGPDPKNGWASGSVIQLWYKEPDWPPNSFAPYKILLDDGKNIFAPGDLETIIRKEEDLQQAE